MVSIEEGPVEWDVVTSDLCLIWGCSRKLLVLHFCFSHVVIPRIKIFLPFYAIVYLKNLNLQDFVPDEDTLLLTFASSPFSGLITLSSISFCSSAEAAWGTSADILLPLRTRG